MKKIIYSLPALGEALQSTNRRYLEFVPTLDDPTTGIDCLRKVSDPAQENDRSCPGLSFFSTADQRLIETLARGEFNLRGLQNKSLRAHLSKKTSGQGEVAVCAACAHSTADLKAPLCEAGASIESR
jgi:hypothetical protein